MNKLLFCARYYLDVKDHLAKKFSQQITALTNMGYVVYYVCISDGYIGLYCDGKLIQNYCRTPKLHIPLLYNILLYRKLYTALEYSIEKEDVQWIYCRSLFPIKSALKALVAAKKKNIKVVMEIPTYPPQKEYSTEKRFLRYHILKYLEKKNYELSPYVDLYTLIGEPANSYLGRPAINISNGIDVTRFPIHVSKRHEKEIHLMALATMSKWHGFDRLIEGINVYVHAQYTIKPIVHFIGGDGDGSLAQWKLLAKQYNLDEFIVFHGPLYDEALNAVFNLCDVGIASLCMHRIGITEASVLKIREYMARGIPFVYATTDPCIPDEYDFTYRVSQDDTPIDIKEVIDFYEKCIENTGFENTMHQYAVENMTWESQFSKIFNCF